MKDNFFINLHKYCIENGELYDDGLCNTILNIPISTPVKRIEKKIFFLNLFEPSIQEQLELIEVGGYFYWGYGKHFSEGDSYTKMYEYTPLRQNMILLCHEILNG